MDPAKIKRMLETPIDKDSQASPEEIRQALESRGVRVGEWTEHEEQVIKEIPLLERQKKHLRNLSAILEDQVKQDKATLAELHIQLQRLKHGGGGA